MCKKELLFEIFVKTSCFDHFRCRDNAYLKTSVYKEPTELRPALTPLRINSSGYEVVKVQFLELQGI